METTATGTQDLTTLTPRRVDELWAPFGVVTSAARNARYETDRSIAKHRRYGRVPSYLTARLERQEAAVASALAAEAPFLAEYRRRGGWTRYEQCLSAGGHIHISSPVCHTLTPGATLVAPLPELTGMTEAEVVAKVGYAACTHCFPFAPTVPAWISGQQVAEAAEAAKKADRCGGSGKYTGGGGRRYGKCPDCGRSIGLSRGGALVAHKPR